MLSRLLREHQARQSERRELQGKPAQAAQFCKQAAVDHLWWRTSPSLQGGHHPPPIPTLPIFRRLSRTLIPPNCVFPPVPLAEIGDVENWARSHRAGHEDHCHRPWSNIYPKGQLQPACS
uniref:Uncharacterized protein n=1 Tax=Coturnix japonica TaxID=93934 RepID=A0A8C2SV34_COTJA